MIGNTVENPYQVFYDNDGLLLEDGYIYVGVSGLNAETNPVSTYWDKDFIYPTGQPIRTLNGIPVRNGSAAAIYVKQQDYSIIVKNKNEELVFSALVFSGFENEYLNPVNSIAELRLVDVSGINANQLITVTGYYSAGDTGGGVFYWDATSAEADDNGTIIQVTGVTTGRFKRIYSGSLDVHWFGAKGDGVTDDLTAITDAFVTGSVIFHGGLTYDITDEIAIDGKDISIDSHDGTPFTVNQSTTGKSTFIFNNGAAAVATTTISADVSYNQPVINVTSAAGFEVGQILHMQSNKEWYYDSRPTYKGETQVIREISGTVITLEKNAFDSYGITSTIGGTTEIVTVNVYDPISANIKNMKCVYPVDSLTTGWGVWYGKYVRVDNVVNENSATSGFGFGTCYDVVVSKSKVIRANRTGTGYGISIGSSTLVEVLSSDLVSCRAGVDFTGTTPSRLGLVDGCFASAPGDGTGGGGLLSETSARGFGTHGGAEFIKFTNNIMTNLLNGIVSRGGNIEISNNYFYGNIKRCVTIAYGADVRVFNNIADAAIQHPTYLTGSAAKLDLTPEHFIQIGQSVDADGKFEIFGNEATARVAFMELQNNLVGSFTALDVRNNKVYLDNQNDRNKISLIDGSPITPILTFPCVIKDNVVTMGDGIYNGIIGKEVTAKVITNITQANPAVVTCVGHEGSTGDQILISSVVGMVEVNDLKFTIVKLTDDTFQLKAIDSTTYTAYGSGGTADMPTSQSILVRPRYMKELDDYIMSDISNVVVSSGTGVLDEVELLLNIESKNGVVKIIGSLSFDMTVGTGRVQIRNLPKINGGQSYYLNDTVTERYCGFLGVDSTSLTLSYDTVAVNTVFPVATGHSISFDISYRRNANV